MKKIILSAAALFLFGFANAQEATSTTESKGFVNGDSFISGSVGYSSTKTGDFKSDSFNISPQVGFFVSDNIAIGAFIAYTSESGDQVLEDTAFEVKTTAIAAGAFARYYATPTSDFSFFGQFEVGYVSAKSEVEGTDFESKANGFALGLSPGISYFISSNWALEASMGALSYSSVKPDFDGAESTNNFELNLDMTDITFGVIYKF